MRASLPPRLSGFGKPPSKGMVLQQRQPYVPYTRERNYACRITECTFRGLRCVVLENQVIRVSVAADKGADIYEFLHKPTDTEFSRVRRWDYARNLQYYPPSTYARDPSPTSTKEVGRSYCRLRATFLLSPRARSSASMAKWRCCLGPIT